ncbi:shikimate kinase [Agaribacterium haliotis]|uniref:shikimate kinase n=1 Tax=Agaribacterium haliotis TaxID=2013869 RepID=UPI000BB594E7|nr:shikimate kinase [Agaribacterium haliotis]
MKNNVILIGMPGAGKSTLGRACASELQREFIDTDKLIEQRAQQKLQVIVDQHGHMALRKLEAEVLGELNCSNSIVATGGSAVYSSEAMQHLKHIGHLVHLDLSLSSIDKRITNFASRGLARAPGQDLEALYLERQKLYSHWAEQRLDCEKLNQDQATKALLKLCKSLTIQ